MSDLGGTKVIASIRPNDSLDLYPSHEAIYGKGGLRTVNGLDDRSAITADRREEGMMCYVISSSEYYTLDTDLSSWTTLSFGGASSTIVDISSIGDVVIAAASANDVLTFFISSSQWKNLAPGAAGDPNYLTHECGPQHHKLTGLDVENCANLDIGPLVVIDMCGNLVFK